MNLFVSTVAKENHSPVKQLEPEHFVVDQPLCPEEIATCYSILPGVRLNSQVYMDNLHHRYYKHSSHNKRMCVLLNIVWISSNM